MTDEFSLAELLSHAINTDRGVSEILGQTRSTLLRDAAQLISISRDPDQLQVTFKLSTLASEPTIETLARLSTRISEIVAEQEGTETRVTVCIHVSSVD